MEGVRQRDLYGIDPYRSSLVGEAPLDVADAYSADTAYCYEHVCDVGGDLLPDVREAFEWLEGRAPVALRRPGTATSPTTRLGQPPPAGSSAESITFARKLDSDMVCFHSIMSSSQRRR